MTAPSEAVPEPGDRPRVKTQYSVVVHGPDLVELREGVWNATSVTLTDDAGGGRLLAVIDALDGTSTVAEIAARTGVRVADVQDVCARLLSARAAELAPSSALDHYVATLMAGDELAPVTARTALVLGDGEIAAQTHEHLAASAEAASVERFADDALWRRLCQDNLAGREGDALHGERLLDEFATFRDTLLVAALDVVNPILLRNLNRIAIGLNVPWVHAASDGPFLVVGPTVVPGRSPCYECFERRVALNMRESDSYVRYKRALAQGQVRLGRPVLPAPVRSLVASLVSLEAVNHLVAGSTFTIGKALTVYLPTMEFCYHDVLRLPSCRVCVPRREAVQRQLHFDVRTYLNQVAR
ncbi:TOMM precursor leader peptide-binding protein [Actinomadura barringtoniae]|uniref:TOMM leader peptide-binding protein n=1 Tax=Actinomadura barringtoniae TaxID=1427535 RepID=A0A939PD54_9ACTN|nr:TOMM precursor leader peptide-binding protein [Actinomadura barringtoniae]MBO2446296.1 TOMM precursor leader peptide-binding protein [Actinomadura barringtoniae]